jgi:hypothetical protein
LSEHELEELAHADIWSEARTLAAVALSAGMTPTARFRRVDVRELNSIVAPALGLVNILTLRGALLDFFHFQEDDGKIPDEIEHGDVASSDPTTFGRSQPLPNAKREPGGIDQEISLWRPSAATSAARAITACFRKMCAGKKCLIVSSMPWSSSGTIKWNPTRNSWAV